MLGGTVLPLHFECVSCVHNIYFFGMHRLENQIENGRLKLFLIMCVFSTFLESKDLKNDYFFGGVL